MGCQWSRRGTPTSRAGGGGGSASSVKNKTLSYYWKKFLFSGGSRGVRDARLLSVHFFSFMQFSIKLMPNNRLVTPPPPPTGLSHPLGNPRSATGIVLGNPRSATGIVTDISEVWSTKHLKHFFPWPVEFRDGDASFRRYLFYWWVSHGSWWISANQYCLAL